MWTKLFLIIVLMICTSAITLILPDILAYTSGREIIVYTVSLIGIIFSTYNMIIKVIWKFER